jgi:hypothetical protein
MVRAMSWPPARPELPADQCAEGDLGLRYEDLAQDGRIQLTALPHTFGTLIWSRLLADHPITRLARAEAVLPILTKLVITGENEPLPLTRPLQARGGFDLARAGDGDDRRLILNIWADVRGERGRTYGPPPPGAGQVVPVGAVYGEHVFTRPFAPRGRRRVSRFDAPDLPEIPERQHAYLSPATLLELPPGATFVDDEDWQDPAPITFGLAHTDSNQHVNSLVYPRLFEEAVLRRLSETKRRTAGRLMRRAEMGYRRPCFAGDRVRIRLRLYERGDAVGAVGLVAAEGSADDEAARCYVRVEMG